MDQKTHDKGLEVRKAVLGEAYVNNALKTSTVSTSRSRILLNEYCWGGLGPRGIAAQDRSMLNIAMISILNRPHELRAPSQGRLTNGVTREEIREILMQVAIYGGMPAAVDSFPQSPANCLPNWTRVKANHHGHRIHWLGNMGYPMARRLVEAKHQLVVFDTRREAVDRLVGWARKPRRRQGVADRVETVMASLPSLQARSRSHRKDGVIEGSQVKRFVDLSTVGSQMAVRIHGILASRNIVHSTVP